MPLSLKPFRNLLRTRLVALLQLIPMVRRHLAPKTKLGKVQYKIGRRRILTRPSCFLILFLFRAGNLSGVISERDYITKIALLGRKSSDTKVKEIATMSSKLITANVDESVEACMEKMLSSDIRHLPLINDSGDLEGMISIKDLVRTTVIEKDETIKVLSDFALGKGGHFGSE